MRDAKTESEARLMARVNELTACEGHRDRLVQAENSALGEIVDHKRRLYELDAAAKAAATRLERAKGRCERIDASVHAARTGTGLTQCSRIERPARRASRRPR